MRIFISVDMEGLAGVATYDQVVRGGSGYPRAQQLMTAEANAAVRGAYDAGASEVVVNDSHGTMDNLLVDQLDSRARVILGRPRPSCMVQGITRDDALAIFVGYHAPAGGHGVLAHTFSSNFTEVRLNGAPVSEADVNALYAGVFGVPVGVVTGDDQICQLVEKALPGVATVEVKRAEGFSATDSLSPAEACDRIASAVHGAVSDPGSFAPAPTPEEWRLEVDFASPLYADFAASVPATTRVSALTLSCAARGADEVVQLLTAWYHLAALASQQTATLAVRR